MRCTIAGVQVAISDGKPTDLTALGNQLSTEIRIAGVDVKEEVGVLRHTITVVGNIAQLIHELWRHRRPVCIKQEFRSCYDTILGIYNHKPALIAVLQHKAGIVKPCASAVHLEHHKPVVCWVLEHHIVADNQFTGNHLGIDAPLRSCLLRGEQADCQLRGLPSIVRHADHIVHNPHLIVGVTTDMNTRAVNQNGLVFLVDNVVDRSV